MANKKISAFDTLTTIPGGPITFNDVLGIAGYCDDPLAPGNNINIQFSGADIITAGSQGLDSVLGVDDTAVGKDIILSDGGFNEMTLRMDSLNRNNGSQFTWSGNGAQYISNTACGAFDLLVLETSAGGGCNSSILINSRSPGTGILKLKTATDIQVDLPVAPTVGQVLSAKNVSGYVEWTSSDVAITKTANSTFIVEVNDPTDIPATLAADTTYIIRGTITTSTPIVVSNSGSSIIGFDRNKDKLVWTGAGAMLTITDVDFDIESVWLSSTLTGSTLIDATNFDALEYNAGRDKVLTITNCQIRNCFDIMSAEGFDLIDISNTLFFYVEAPSFGLKFLNTSKIEITSCELIRWFDETSLPTPAGYSTASMIEISPNGTGPGIGAMNISGCIIHPQQTQVGVKINPLSTTGFGTIAANTFVNVGLVPTATTGLVFFPIPATGGYSETECLKYDVFSNQGLPNSVAYGSFYDSTGGIDTLTGGTTNWIPVEYGAVPLAASTQRISFSNPATQRGLLTYNGTKSIFTQVSVSITYNDTSGGTDVYNFGLSKNGAATPEAASIISSQASGGAYFGVTLLFTDSMVTGDNYELIAQNQGGGAGDDIEVTSVQFLIKE